MEIKFPRSVYDDFNISISEAYQNVSCFRHAFCEKKTLFCKVVWLEWLEYDSTTLQSAYEKNSSEITVLYDLLIEIYNN